MGPKEPSEGGGTRGGGRVDFPFYQSAVKSYPVTHRQDKPKEGAKSESSSLVPGD